MSLTFHGHPFSSYCQKVLTALYENDTPFDFAMVNFGDADNVRAFAALWPLKKMPVLVDDGVRVVESTVIIEHLDLFHPGAVRLIPTDPKAALAARTLDRVFDNYVMNPASAVVFESMRPAEARDPHGVRQAKAQLDAAYAWLDGELAGREWAAGDAFTLADCAAAPSLFYADWVHPIAETFSTLRAYRARLLARPSFARAVEGGRPYRNLFPLGAPDRD